MRFVLAVALTLVVTSTVFAQELKELPKNADGAYVLFNGKDLSGWDGDPRFWSVQDGAITGQTTAETPTKGNTFLIFRGGKPADFELHASFWLHNHNSGIQYRSKEDQKWVMGGYQADMDGQNTYTGMMYEERRRGIVMLPGQKVVLPEQGKPQVTGQVTERAAVKAAIKPEWNEYVITCKGNHLVQKINGVVTADITDDNPKARAMDGLIGLQLHAGQPMKVQFKDITLKILD